MVYGGSRSGKTFLLCYAIITRALKASGSRHAIFRKHGVSVKQSIGLDTIPKVMSLAYPEVDVKWKDKDGYFQFGNGSEIWLAGLDDKERVDKVLGKEFATLYFNEASEIALASYDVAQTRLAQRIKQVDGRWLSQKNYIDLNPTTKSHWTYRMWVDGYHPDGELELDMNDYGHIIVNPFDNLENLDPAYLKKLEALPERQKNRFFHGKFIGDVEGALWRRSWIKRTRTLPDMDRVVVAIDPAISTDVGSDETGIVVVGLGVDGIGYLLEDASGKYRPEEWASRAVSLYDQWEADRIVAEINQGGQMVESILRTIRANIPYTAVTATRGKVIRAEPIASLYELDKVKHFGEWSILEDQLCSFTIGFDRKAQGYSPDRLDALVWGLTFLFPSMVVRTQPVPVRVIPTVNPMAGM